MSVADGSAATPATDGGIVYACVESGGEFAKVGWASSLDHAYARWINLQIGNPRALTLLVVGPGDRAAERALHEALHAQAVRGEWFRVEGAVAEIVARARPLPPRAGSGSGRPRTERDAAQAWLAAALAGEPLRAGDVFRAAALHGHSVKTVRRAAAELGVIRTPPGGGRTCAWRMP